MFSLFYFVIILLCFSCPKLEAETSFCEYTYSYLSVRLSVYLSYIHLLFYNHGIWLLFCSLLLVLLTCLFFSVNHVFFGF